MTIALEGETGIVEFEILRDIHFVAVVYNVHDRLVFGDKRDLWRAFQEQKAQPAPFTNKLAPT
jgi:hypothetical protein